MKFGMMLYATGGYLLIQVVAWCRAKLKKGNDHG